MDDEALGRAFADVTSRRYRAMGGEALDVDGLVLLFHDLPAEEINHAVVRSAPRDAVAALEEAEAVFVAWGRRFGLDLQAGRHPGMDDAVRSRGLELLFARSLMTAPLDVVPRLPAPEGCELAMVAAVDDLEALASVDAVAFETSSALSRTLYADGMLDLPGAAMVLARLDGHPVGGAIAVATEGSVGIFGVAVLPDARRRGIGAALTSRAAFAVACEGDEVWLQPSDMARSIYEGLGFRDRAVYEVWVGPPLPRPDGSR